MLDFEVNDPPYSEDSNDVDALLSAMNIKGKVVDIKRGIRIKTYFIELEIGEKVSKVTSLATELMLVLKISQPPRIYALPLTNLIAIETITTDKPVKIMLQDVLSQVEINDYKLPLVVGCEMDGKPYIVDLIDAPHLLIGGTSGAGKSELCNTIAHSLVERYKNDRNSLELILVDPKGTELVDIKNIHPNVLHVHASDMIDKVLDKALSLMEQRFDKFRALQVKDIERYRKVKHMSYIVIIIDELADILMNDPKKLRHNKIVRLLQKCRATGIHFIANTQRPGADVITGTMKANLDAKIALKTTDRHHSTTILGHDGAEKLVGKGDMLIDFYGKVTRVQGALVA